MTTSYPAPGSAPGPVPPPGCPAHAGAGGPQRIYGPDAEPLGPLYEQLREEHGPVAPVLVPGDIPAWLILGYDLVRNVMQTNQSLVVCDSRHGRVYREGLIPADSPLRPMTAYEPVVAFEDGQPHARLRSAVGDGLDFNRHSLRRYISRHANRLIDAFAARGTADLVTEFAEQLPALVLAWMYGMPEEEGPGLVTAVRDLTSGTERAAEGNAFVVATMRELVRRKRSRPGGRDFVSRLISHGSNLTDKEIEEHLRLVFVAGCTPTVALIANTLREMLTQRRFSQNLTSGQMTLPDALNRVLWDHPPIGLLPTRWAAGDMVLGGKHIQEGDMVVLGIEAGNADPAVRNSGTPVANNEGHLSFSTGPHECPGRDIGRAIAEVGIDILLTRLVRLELAVPEGELRWESAWVSRRLVSLPVTFAPSRSTARQGTEQPVDTAVPAAAAAAPPSGAVATAPQAATPATPPTEAPRTGRARRSRGFLRRR